MAGSLGSRAKKKLRQEIGKKLLKGRGFPPTRVWTKTGPGNVSSQRISVSANLARMPHNQRAELARQILAKGKLRKAPRSLRQNLKRRPL